MKGVVFTTDGKMFVKEFTQPLYKSVGDVVEGWIEVVHPRGLEDPFCFICNEEGLLRDLPLNAIGSLWYGTLQHGHPIAGNIVVMKEGITEEGPDMLGLLDNLASRYEIHRKETSLALFHEELPETVKIYIVSKKIEGLSQATLDTYLRMLKLFFRDIGKSPAQITTNDIRVYLYRYQQERGCSNRSLDKYRQYLAGFFSWAADEGYVQSNPMRTIPAIKYEKKPRENLTQLELEYLRQCCHTEREKAIIEFLFSTGCRVSELSGVKKSDIDWNARTVHLFGKGSKNRTSFLNAKCEVTLKAYLKTRTDGSEFLFVTERKPYRQLKRDALEKIVRNISGRTSAEMNKHVTPHILRHTTATLAMQNGMPIADISKLLGHAKIDTTMIYAHTCMESVQAGHRKYVV